MAALIGKILKLVKGYGGPVAVRYDDKGDKSVLWKADGVAMLRQDLYSKWDDVGNSEDAGTESAVNYVDGVETKEGSKL